MVLVPLTFGAPRLTPTSVRNRHHHGPAAIFPSFFLAGMLALCAAAGSTRPEIPGGPAIDTRVREITTRTHANGIAVAVIAPGDVQFVPAYGILNAAGQPLTVDTVMYGASLTKTVFGYTVLQLVDQKGFKLDTPIKDDPDRRLPSYRQDPVFPDKYGPYKDLADDPRSGKITPRICLTRRSPLARSYPVERPDKRRAGPFHRQSRAQGVSTRSSRSSRRSAGAWPASA